MAFRILTVFRFIKESLINHPEKQMISLKNISGIIMDLRYASNNNFMHKKLYPENIKTTYLKKAGLPGIG